MDESDEKHWRLSLHALLEVDRRGIAEEVVRGVLQCPEQVSRGHEGRVVYQSRAERYWRSP